MDPRWLFERINRGHVRNVSFADLRGLLEAAGFQLARTHGSHLYFVHSSIDEHLSVQPRNGQAQPHQLRAIASLFRRYNLLTDGER